ncbi:acyl-CoA dehydrogenase family protein [Streptomyces cylindrosporus]|uniref:Acyl-CoA dehydrogenase family protein n=1 Tax=Streptomyces cylindrosporus TaxID=2927583 RepID=A0ABS9YB83_9ACTN|nr:acyl-CoA dehydrogenase family protein [Streptomyces cylindrosporus]MCI3274478.1 acyl-CoA dehydrogenase family protein [Streptomyces cylindrosporus]
MRRTLFAQDHEDFRLLVRDFIAREVLPEYEDWRRAGLVPRELFTALGKLGIIGTAIPEEYGGGGQDDYRFNVVIQEECARVGVTLGGLRTHLDIVVPYFTGLADAGQRERWFPGLASGELYTAIAMSEPGTGSDLAGIRTRAVRDGDHFVLDGAKTFITGGHHADLVIVVARTATDPDDRRAGLSLLVVEKGMAGFTVGRKLEKIGLAVQDTVELSFDAVRVPAANLLGEEGGAFTHLGRNLAQERLAIAVGAVAQTRNAIDLTIGYVRDRTVFGKPVAHFQNTKFELAAMATELEAAQTLLDAAVTALVAGELSPADAAKTKLFCTETQGRVVDRCLQLHGGYGYILESPIARLYADARVTRIYGGTSEVLKTIISKSLGL